MSGERPDVGELLARFTGFDRDGGNTPKVLGRHEVEPGECEQIFFRDPLVVAFDEKHSETESRWQALGRTLSDRKLYLVFTVRGPLIRVIAAREMSRKERRVYEQAQAGVEEDPGLRE